MLRTLDKLMVKLPWRQPKFGLQYAASIPLKIKTSSVRIALKVGQWGYANALIDTGSTYCLIDRKILEEISTLTPSAVGRVTQITPIILSLGDGSTASKINPDAVTMLDVYFFTQEGDEISVHQKFFVCPELNELLVIGHRFFQDNRENGADLSYTKSSLLLKGRLVPWNKSNHVPDSINILTGVLCETLNILPNETYECKVQIVPQKNFWEGGGKPQGEPVSSDQLQHGPCQPWSGFIPQGEPVSSDQLLKSGPCKPRGVGPYQPQSVDLVNPRTLNNFFTNDLVVEDKVVRIRIRGWGYQIKDPCMRWCKPRS